MAFTLTREVTDDEEKALATKAKLETFNGQPVPSAEDYLNSKLESIIAEATKVIVETNDRRREDAIKKAPDKTKSDIDALLGLTKIEDEVDVAVPVVP